MRIKALRKLLHLIIDAGYGDMIVWFCDDDDDDYSVDKIYIDDAGEVCLESTDVGCARDYTAREILSLIKVCDREDYVYFRIHEDGDNYDCYILSEWYIGEDDYGYSIINIDCTEM